MFPVAAARERWREAVRQGAVPEDIIGGARAYAAEQARMGKVGTQYVKTADAWLNLRCWGDYRPEVQAVPALRVVITDAQWRQHVQTWKARLGHWPWSGPAPDQPDTLVPPHILQEFGIGEGLADIRPLDAA